ncbi:proteinase-activated receptor 1-like [Clarias gariepinus]|uniref:proteinase-activated receptor 1-like n=1 Tax=Clarias gariepinus TaxID=13013 RepID=UPI00234DD46F|nr:proteinase-activated receptor 1-like [Clarias gariepinus]
MHVVGYLLGLPLNSYVMVLLLNRRRSLDPCDVFTVNQAAAEIFFMLVAPFHILLYVSSETWFYHPLAFIFCTGMSVRALLQCWVCLDRYTAVIHPITFLKFRPLRYRVVMCVVAWINGIAVGIYGTYTFPAMPYQVFGVTFYIILSINTFSCLSILNTLRHPGPGERNTNRGMEDRAKKRAFQVVVINLVTFLVQNTPVAVIFILIGILPATVSLLSSEASMAVNIVMSFLQPVFVLHKAGKF